MAAPARPSGPPPPIPPKTGPRPLPQLPLPGSRPGIAPPPTPLSPPAAAAHPTAGAGAGPGAGPDAAAAPKAELTPEQQAAAKIEKSRRVRAQIAKEVMTTEVSYVEGLAALVKIAIDYLRKNEVLTEVEMNTLFSQAATIYTFNEQFCGEVKGRIETYTDDTQVRLSPISS